MARTRKEREAIEAERANLGVEWTRFEPGQSRRLLPCAGDADGSEEKDGGSPGGCDSLGVRMSAGEGPYRPAFVFSAAGPVPPSPGEASADPPGRPVVDAGPPPGLSAAAAPASGLEDGSAVPGGEGAASSAVTTLGGEGCGGVSGGSPEAAASAAAPVTGVAEAGSASAAGPVALVPENVACVGSSTASVLAGEVGGGTGSAPASTVHVGHAVAPASSDVMLGAAADSAGVSSAGGGDPAGPAPGAVPSAPAPEAMDVDPGDAAGAASSVLAAQGLSTGGSVSSPAALAPEVDVTSAGVDDPAAGVPAAFAGVSGRGGVLSGSGPVGAVPEGAAAVGSSTSFPAGVAVIDVSGMGESATPSLAAVTANAGTADRLGEEDIEVERMDDDEDGVRSVFSSIRNASSAGAAGPSVSGLGTMVAGGVEDEEPDSDLEAAQLYVALQGCRLHRSDDPELRLKSRRGGSPSPGVRTGEATQVCCSRARRGRGFRSWWFHDFDYHRPRGEGELLTLTPRTRNSPGLSPEGKLAPGSLRDMPTYAAFILYELRNCVLRIPRRAKRSRRSWTTWRRS